MLAQALPINNKDRLTNARKNRQLQLERWDYYEKESHKAPPNGTHRAHHRNIQFSKNIILLDAVSRNDIKEGEQFLSSRIFLVSDALSYSFIVILTSWPISLRSTNILIG